MDINNQRQTHRRPWEDSDGEDQSSPAADRPDGRGEGQVTTVPTPMKRACNECRQQKVGGYCLALCFAPGDSLTDMLIASV